jgi:hypothetical protein
MEGWRFRNQRSLGGLVWPPNAAFHICQYMPQLGLGPLAAPAFLGSPSDT